MTSMMGALQGLANIGKKIDSKIPGVSKLQQMGGGRPLQPMQSVNHPGMLPNLDEWTGLPQYRDIQR